MDKAVRVSVVPQSKIDEIMDVLVENTESAMEALCVLVSVQLELSRMVGDDDLEKFGNQVRDMIVSSRKYRIDQV